MASLTQQSLAGIRWSAITQLLGQAAQYGSFVVLARLLSPADFGYVACATLAIGLVAMLNELGLGAALIQRKELSPGHLNACFWSNLAAGGVLWAAMAFTAPLIAGFFHSAPVAPLLVWLALSFPLVGLAVVPKALLERELRFKPLGLIDAAAAIVGAAIAIGLAFGGFGAWSLIAGTLATYAVQLIGVWSVAAWRPGLSFTRRELGELFSFGLSVLGTRLVGYVNANVDYLVIGRLLGPTALGAYSLAYKLVTWPMLKISHATLRVIFPAFSRIQHDDAAMRRQYLRVVGTLALVIFPLLAGLAVLAPEVVPLVFGDHWAAAVVPTQLLCAAGALKAMVCSVGTVFLSKGRPDLELKINLYGTLQLTAFVMFGVSYGTVGVAMAVLCSSLIGAPLQQWLANRLVGLTMADYLRGLVVPAVATLAMGVAVVAWRMLTIAHGAPGWAVIAGAIPLAIVAYLSTMSALGFDWRGLASQLIGRRMAKPQTV